MALFRDNTLTEIARMIGLAVLQKGAPGDWVEVTHDELSQLLHDYPSSDTIRRHVGRLERAGWIETRDGGRGHGQNYRIVYTGTDADLKSTDADLSTDRVGTRADLSAPVVVVVEK